MRVIWQILIIIVVLPNALVFAILQENQIYVKKTIALLHMFKPKHFNLGHTA